MSGRPPSGSGPPTLRVEILKELQQLIDSRDARDRIDKSPLAETKGREHWVLHLLLRATESMQAHVDALVGSAYANLIARLQSLEDRVEHVEELEKAGETEVRDQLAQVSKSIGEHVDMSFEKGVARIDEGLKSRLTEDLTEKWKPVGESIETFASGSRQVLKDVGDTYRVATQTRLLLNENARRLTDLGRDLVALEESLKLVVARTLEEGIAPLEQRIAAIEGHLSLATTNGRPVEKNESSETGQ